MNNYVLVGIIAAVVAVGVGGVYAMSQTDISIPSSQDSGEMLDDIRTDIEDIDPGYGQVTKQEGAYSP